MRKDGSVTIPGVIVVVLMGAACAAFGSAASDYLNLRGRVTVLEAVFHQPCNPEGK
jgi:hypothetical protein